MFQNLNISTTMSISPCATTGHDIIYITRGATASLAFNFYKEVYDFDYVDQITFVFKQQNIVRWFQMFTYIKPSADTSVVDGKTYYANVRPIEADSLQCTGDLVANPEGDPSSQNLYELITEGGSWRNDYYIIDEHFYHASGEGYDYVTLTLSSAETKEFSVTCPETNMLCEVAIRLNTDIFESLHYKDSVIIEPQHPIAVIDSLYSRL